MAEKGFIKQLLSFLDDGWSCCRIFYDKRFSVFHYPVTDEDAPNYRSIIQNPMDVATLLQRVDSGQYLTCAAFLQDVDLIVTNAKVWVCYDFYMWSILISIFINLTWLNMYLATNGWWFTVDYLGD